MLIFELPPEIDRSEYQAYLTDSLDFFQLDLTRVSELLKFQMYCGYKFRLFNSYAVSEEIKAFELAGKKSNTKEADHFLHRPLRGLKKKHWADPHQIPRNLINELKEDRFATNLSIEIQEFFKINDGKLLDDQLISEMVRVYTDGALSSRIARQAMTGHWLIFAEYKTQKYYLTIASHDEGDQAIFERIKMICYLEFPFLESLMHD
jgi:hypothetical protein